MGVIQQSNPVTVAGELKTPYPELVHGLPVAVYCTDKDGLITMSDGLSVAVPGQHMGTRWIESVALQFLRYGLLTDEDDFADCPKSRLLLAPLDKFHP